ncbi:MAG: hypothetical protein ABI178_04335 [Rhodanobacter sp.]
MLTETGMPCNELREDLGNRCLFAIVESHLFGVATADIPQYAVILDLDFHHSLLRLRHDISPIDHG